MHISCFCIYLQDYTQVYVILVYSNYIRGKIDLFSAASDTSKKHPAHRDMPLTSFPALPCVIIPAHKQHLSDLFKAVLSVIGNTVCATGVKELLSKASALWMWLLWHLSVTRKPLWMLLVRLEQSSVTHTLAVDVFWRFCRYSVGTRWWTGWFELWGWWITGFLSRVLYFSP